MRIRLLCVTHKTPIWLKEGYEDYVKRLPSSYHLELIEIPAQKRKNALNIQQVIEKEGKQLLSAIKPQHLVIALDVAGQMLSTEDLARYLNTWQQHGQSIDLLIGGPDGLSPACLERANLKWSLSELTFPHFLVKLIIAEQIYRAWSINTNHPYHRGNN